MARAKSSQGNACGGQTPTANPRAMLAEVTTSHPFQMLSCSGKMRVRRGAVGLQPPHRSHPPPALPLLPQGGSAPCQGSGSSLAASLPAFRGFSLPRAPFPSTFCSQGCLRRCQDSLCFPRGGRGCSSLQTPVLSARIFKDSLKPEGWDAESS